MRKLAAILLLCLLAFNLVGYRYFFSWLQQRHKISFEAKLDKDKYSDKDLVELKISLSLPYVSDQAQFERVDGYLNIKGKSYKYVKRKIENGHLVLLCLPDKRKMRIDHAKNEFGSSANDLPDSGRKNSESIKKVAFTCEFEEVITPICNNNFIQTFHLADNSAVSSIRSGFLAYTDKPPQIAC